MELPVHTFPAEAERGCTLPSCFSSQTVSKCPSWGLSGAVFHISALSLVTFPPGMALSTMMREKAELCPRERGVCWRSLVQAGATRL